MSIAIEVKNLSKQYRLGQIGTGSIAHDLNRWWHSMQGKEDPYLKIGETNDRTKAGNSEYVWSLKDINFTINKGDAVGIIGRNGAGKSTLLKILSRVTTPTTGTAKARGRIASLLEVGTGFHPDLSGRDNVFLNGAILGMRKHEIQKHFDEIVDFAGVERYIDTPVKRYSSGMYVRLAFAVSAFLQSEILIVDEVLAVGDAEFQKKCLGKMSDVSKGEGKTVLFVSHNLSAVRQLCNNGIYLQNGQIRNSDNVNNILQFYLNDNPINVSAVFEIDASSKLFDKKVAYIRKLVFNDGKSIFYGKPLKIDIYCRINKPVENLVAGVAFANIDGSRVATFDSEITLVAPTYYNIKQASDAKISFFIENFFFQPTLYKIDVGIRDSLLNSIDYLPECCVVEVKVDKDTPPVLFELKELGNIRPPIQVEASFS